MSEKYREGYCTDCNKSINIKYKKCYKCHMLGRSNCEKCGREIDKKYTLCYNCVMGRSHLYHTEESYRMSYQYVNCIHCGELTSSNTDAENHIQHFISEHEDIAFNCHLCDKKYSSFDDLAHHWSIENNVDDVDGFYNKMILKNFTKNYLINPH